MMDAGDAGAQDGHPILPMTAPCAVGTKRNRLDSVFYLLALGCLGEIGALVYQLTVYPNTGGMAHQSFLARLLLGLLVAPSALLLGAVILWRVPGNSAGRFLIAFAMAAVAAQFNNNMGSPRRTALAEELLILYGAGIALPALIYLLFTFPTSAVYPQRWARWLAVFWLIKFGGAALEIAATPHALKMFILPSNPFLIPALAPYRMIIATTIGITGVMLPLGLGAGMLSLILRYRTASVRQQQQIKWVIWAFALLMLALGINLVTLNRHPAHPLQINGAIVLGSLAMLLFLATLATAILRHRLFDIDLIINRTLVYGGLTASVLGLYALMVGALGRLFELHGNFFIAILATGAVAILFQPLRERLQRTVNRWMYGERDEPYIVLSRLGQHLEATLVPEAVLPTIVETVAQTLKLPYAAVAMKEGETFPIVAAWGRPTKRPSDTESEATTQLVRLPLVYQTETLGQLLIGRRAVGEAFTLTEQRLLADIAHQAGVAVHAVRLTADLQRSRERLVTLREDERRRIRRDLHDGLGPTLASMKLKLDALHYLLAPAQAEAHGIVTELETDMQAALTDIRRLVYDLRPPTLDQLGLVSAIQEYALGLSVSGLQITVEGPSPLPPLPAAVEVAAYRIVLEALTNTMRHAQAHVCRIHILLESAPFTLRLEISDDGVGLPTPVQAGVGLTSMRERAAELGGTCSITSAGNGGTQVCARLPCPPAKGEQPWIRYAS